MEGPYRGFGQLPLQRPPQAWKKKDRMAEASGEPEESSDWLPWQWILKRRPWKNET